MTTDNQRRLPKLIHVVPTLDQSGAEKQLALLAANLPRDRFDLSVCCLTRGGHYERVLRDAGVRVDVLGKRTKLDPILLYRLYRYLRAEKPDLVQTWLFAGNSYGRLAARWAKVPMVVASERCVDAWKRSHQFTIDRYLAHWTNTVIVNSHAVSAFYQKVGIAADKLRVIKNAIEPAAAPALGRNEKLAQLGLPTEHPTVGFIGRLWPQKRVQDLIWSADTLRLSGWRITALIVGDGPRRSALEKFAHDLELDESVRFLGHRSDVDELLQAMDVFVLPSQFEGMPNVVLEAMRAGKPVVATRIAGMDELVIDDATGLLVPVKQPFELARAIRRILADRELAARLGSAGRQRAVTEFSVEKMVNEYVRLYDELLA